MGHVKVGAFDVTIENPKGSERSGTDANGKKWSVKMNNTYGYIRGTEGVDGDHIDVFLAEDMDKWDGKYVFVVDQYNPDGTFDEHKVMLGFNSTEEARSAYLSNYEKGWENGRRIVVARIKTDGFQKWVDSSHRKTKPFAHYVIAGAADVSDNEKKPSASKKGKPHVSKKDEVKRTVEHFPMETPEEAAAFDKRIPEMEDAELLAYMQEDGKGDINSAYHMNIYDEYDYRHTDEQTEAYNIYIQQLHDSNTTLEQAEEMLGNILGDVEQFATDERSQLLGQSDALQDYITELERQKEDERAEAENKPNQNENDRATPSSTSDKMRMQKTQGYSEFAEKHGVNTDDVRAYAEGMALGNVVMANQAFTEIRRTKRIEHRGMKLSEFAKAFNPIKEELYEKFGNVDELNQEYVRLAEEERNMMEAARKKAEEEERKRQAHLDELSLLDDAAIDERYMEALQRGDEATAREMLDEAARRKGYGDTASDYQGVGAWVAPANPGYENDADRRADVEDNAPDVNIEDIALGYSLVDEKYWQEPRKYMQTDATAIESVNAIREAIAAVRRGEKNVKVKVYRAVPTSVKEGKLRNGDWVTPSKDYAKMHGEHRLEGKYRIIEDEVSVDELWWDGNDSREWGFDNGKGYKYKNVKNNRKSDDLVTRDDKGNVIPPSKRFNQRKPDERYQKTGTPLTPNSAEVALRDAIADLMRKSGLDVLESKEGQRVLDEANGMVRQMSFGEAYDYEAYPLGRVEPNLLEKEVNVVKADADHGFANYKEAKAWAKENVAKVYDNEESGGKGDVRISNAAIDKFMSQSAIDKSDSKDVHMAVLKVLPDVLKSSIDVETHPDFLKGEDGKRRVENGMNKDVLVHRCYGAVSIDGKPYRVKMTLKEDPRDVSSPHVTHSYEATKIELLAGTWENQEGPSPNTNNSISAAKLLENVGLSYNSGEKVLDASKKRSYGIRKHRVYHGSGVRFFRTSNGEAYGFTVGGKIYIDPRIATAETPIHEYAHLWATAMREGNPTEWKNIVGLMKGTSVWAEVQKLYPELKNDDDIADEVLATFSGRRGAERLRAEQQKIMQGNGSVFEKATAVGALARVKQALSKFWKGVADFLGIHYTSAEEVADRVMKDLLEGFDPRKYGGKNDERVRKQFIGEKGAAAADHAEEVGVRLDNLAVARKMEEAGKDAKAIKMATGWERGADGKWRYEVGDVRFYDGLQLVNRNEKSTVTLNDLLEDNKEKDALFASYPSLKDMPVTLEDMGYNGAGEYSYKDKSLRLNTYLLTDDSGRFTEPAVSILNHEIQHAIQHIEGFARGGSLEEGQHYADEHKPLTPVQGDFVDTVNLYDKNKHTLSETYTLAKFVKDWAMFNDDDFSKDLLGMSDEQIRSEYERLKERQQYGGKPSRLNGFDAYKRFSGEVESRNVEARMGMTDEERRASLAAETEDVSREDQIFLQNGLNGVSESREPSIWLPKDEYAKVAHAIATNTGFKKTGMNEVFTDNNYYIYTAKKNGDFIVRFGLPIEGNEDIINELSKGVKDGTIRNTRSLHSVIERERSERNENNHNNVNAEGRQKSTGAIGDLALRQQADSTGSDGYLGEEIPGRTPAGNSDRGAGREPGRVDDTLYRQGEETSHTTTSSESKTQAAQKATENLNLGGNVVVHESAEGLEGKEATAKGWYDTRTGQIHVVLSNNADAADVTQTILHEAVAHHGLRELFGHNVMDAFLDSVLAAASQEVKDAINELRRGNGWNFRTATEEYLAGLAERTDFERMTAEERGLFATIRRLFNRALEFLGLKNHELSDRELAYILWCSYQNLKTGKKGRYVAEAERIAMRYKLKAGKNAMSDTEKKESAVLLRGKLDNLQEILAKDTYEKLVTSGSHLERTAWVDMLSPLQDLQHAIEKNGGFKLEDFENPYNAYVTMSSRNYAQMDIYKRTLYADMIEAIHALGSETGRSYEEIKTYVMAKHGMERQKYMAEKAAEEAYDRYKSMHPFGQKTLDDFIDEYEEKSFAGLTELFGTQSVSDAMDEAQKYVEEVEAEAGSLADSLWDSIRAATKSSLQRAYEAGLISKETYDNVSSMYQYYIPLRGFDETTSDEVYEYFGDQTINGGTGSFMKKAKGRKSVADDPFAVIGNMAEMAIMQSNRNLMKQQLLNLALNHPSDLISVSDLYVKFDEDYDNGDGTRGAWVPVAVPDTSGMTTEEANQVMLDFQDDMEEKVKDEPDTYALAHQKPHIPYRVLGRNMNEHQVMVKRGGKTYILTINANPRAAQAINGLLNPDATENPGAIALKAMTNWIARMTTARNVEFAISNAMRDLEFSTTLIPKEGTEYYGRYVKNYLTCVKNIGRLVNRLNGNTLDMSNPLEKAFYDFIYNGGETGYTFMNSTIIINFQRVAKMHTIMCDTFCNSFFIKSGAF